MRATIIDANGECLDLGDIEITAEATLNDLAGGRDIAMPAVLVYGVSGSPNFTDTPAWTHGGPLFRPDEADRFPAATFPPSSIVTVKSVVKAMQVRTSPPTLDQWLHEHMNPLESRDFKFALPEPAKGWPDPNRRGARKTRRGRLP